MDKQIKDTSFHMHTEAGSRFDAVSFIKDAVAKLSEYGARAMVITDHGVMTAIEEARWAIDDLNKERKKKAEKENSEYSEMKLIPGVEAYFEEDDDLTHRKHLILVAKDIQGYYAISKAVSESYKRMDSQGIPRMDSAILNRFFGEGTEGHDHVIATSACMAGILASTLLTNNYIQKDIASIEKKMKKLYSPNTPSYLKNKENIANLETEIAETTAEIKRLKELAKKPYKKKENALKAFEGTLEYEERKAALDAEKAESEAAKIRAEELTALCKQYKAKEKKLKEILKNEEKDHVKWYAFDSEIKRLSENLASEDVLYEAAKAEALRFVNIFGVGNFYCELQNHRIEQEIEVMPLIAKIAEELNIPVVAANDAHMINNTPESVKARQIMRSLRFNQWETMDTSDEELYIKTDDELKTILLEILPEEIVDKAFKGITDIVDACNVDFSSESHYPKFKSKIEGETARECLTRLSIEGIEWRYPNREGWTEEHQKRMEYELDVIDQLGVCDYLCIVEDFLRYGRLLGKLDFDSPDPRYLEDPYNIELLEEITKNEVGLGIGPGRGSAVGSLVCYLVGITGIDPIEHDLIFERFLNTERVSMPDIDSDFKPDIRNKVLDYVKHIYGEKAVCCISTKGRQQAKAAIRNCARLLGSERYNDTTYYYNLGDEICKLVPNTVGITLDDCWDLLVSKYKTNKDAMIILNNAKLVEGMYTNVGMHAAGVIIADNGRVGDYVPLMYNKDKGQWMTQCDKDYVESIGLLKMDFLGLRNLGIITNTLKLIQKRYGKSIDIEKVPFERVVFDNIFSKGETNSVFQFESGGMKQMLRQFRPESIDDIVLLVAAYRPGPMQFLDDIIAVKHGRKKPDYVIPEMKEILGKTYGYPIYQEQVMQIFNKFAGFSLGESDIIRRYMSKKKTEAFMKYKGKFVDGMVARGGSPEKVEKFWDQLVDFSKYAFNRSHAAAYAFVAYYTAYLKYHYPKEYLCSVMNDTEFDKLAGLIKDCKNYGIDIAQPNINASENIFAISGDSVLYGLGLVKNVGDAAKSIIVERQENGKFTSFDNFMIRTRCKKDAAESLIIAGAFDDFTENRKALAASVEIYLDIIKKINTKQEKIKEYKAVLTENEDEKILKRTSTLLSKAEKSLKELYDNLTNITIDDSEENYSDRFKAEKDITGAFLSGSPLDAYGSPAAFKCTSIDQLIPKKEVSIMGFISDLRITNRKSDGAPMAFFTLEDATGSISVNCFTNAYSKYADLIFEGAVIKIKGRCNKEIDSFNDEEVLKISAEQIEVIKENKEPIYISVPNIMEWSDVVYEKIKPYLSPTGHPLIVFDELTGSLRKTKFTVGKEILENSILKTRLSR